VVGALIRRFHEAKAQNLPSVRVWGSGTPTREFLFVDDLADACVFVMKHYSALDFLNIGSGEAISIRDFAMLVRDVVGYDGELEFDRTRPDGTPKKLLDVSKLTALGWRARTPLRKGLAAASADYLAGGGRYR
jgi:GDP-L-fucose synthase